MLTRGFVLSLSVLALAPAAHAAVADRYTPVYDPSDGVTVTHGVVHFSAKADAIFRTIRGRRAAATCGSVPDRVALGATTRPVAIVNVTRHRGPVDTNVDGDVCVIATKQAKTSAARCVPVSVSDSSYCARVIVAENAAGLAQLDRYQRVLEISLAVQSVDQTGSDEVFPPGTTPLSAAQKTLGPDLVALDSPDATPAAGKVGVFYANDTTRAGVATLSDGTRLYVRYDNGVISTNVPEFVDLSGNTVSTVFG